MKLQAQLDQHKLDSRQRLPAEKRLTFENQVSKLQASGMAGSIARAGNNAPNFTLPDHRGSPWELQSALRSGPVVLKFYRGTWCPYCNIELRTYQRRLPEIRERGASFVAISPEKPDFAEAYVTKEQIEFPVLTDRGNAVARQFGLEFVVDERLQQLMKELGNNLAEKNGEDTWTLPIPGTFVVSRSRRIEYAFAELDFSLRADPDEVLKVLESL